MCPPGYKKVASTRFDFLFDCEPCSANTAPNKDATQCLPCAAPATYNVDSKACICPDGSKVTEYGLDGTLLTQLACEKCPINQY